MEAMGKSGRNSGLGVPRSPETASSPLAVWMVQIIFNPLLLWGCARV